MGVCGSVDGFVVKRNFEYTRDNAPDLPNNLLKWPKILDKNHSTFFHHLPLMWSIEEKKLWSDEVVYHWKDHPITDIPDKHGDTPLHAAARKGSWAILLFLELKADVHAVNQEGDTPLSALCRYGNQDRLHDDNNLLADHLLKVGSDLNYTSPSGDSPFSLAAASGKAKLVAMFLQRKVRVPSSLHGSMRSSVASVYAMYQYFTDMRPDILNADVLSLMVSYLVPDNYGTTGPEPDVTRRYNHKLEIGKYQAVDDSEDAPITPWKQL